MKFNFLSIRSVTNSYSSENDKVINKVKSAISKNAKLAISPRMDNNGYPYLWIDIILAHKTEGVKLLIDETILNFIFTYLTLGQITELDLKAIDYESARNSYKEKNFQLEMFKYEVSEGKRVYKQPSYHSERYKCFTMYTKGRVLYSFEITKEVKIFLEERDLF